MVAVRRPSWRSQCWLGWTVTQLSLPVSTGGTVDTGPVIDLRPGVDQLVLRVRSEVIVLVVGGRHHRSVLVWSLNDWSELVVGRLVVGLAVLWIGRWS